MPQALSSVDQYDRLAAETGATNVDYDAIAADIQAGGGGPRTPVATGQIRPHNPGLIERGLSALDRGGAVPSMVAGAARDIAAPISRGVDYLRPMTAGTGYEGAINAYFGTNSRVSGEYANPDEQLGAGLAQGAAMLSLPGEADTVAAGAQLAKRVPGIMARGTATALERTAPFATPVLTGAGAVGGFKAGGPVTGAVGAAVGAQQGPRVARQMRRGAEWLRGEPAVPGIIEDPVREAARQWTRPAPPGPSRPVPSHEPPPAPSADPVREDARQWMKPAPKPPKRPTAEPAPPVSDDPVREAARQWTRPAPPPRASGPDAALRRELEARAAQPLPPTTTPQAAPPDPLVKEIGDRLRTDINYGVGGDDVTSAKAMDATNVHRRTESNPTLAKDARAAARAYRHALEGKGGKKVSPEELRRLHDEWIAADKADSQRELITANEQRRRAAREAKGTP